MSLNNQRLSLVVAGLLSIHSVSAAPNATPPGRQAMPNQKSAPAIQAAPQSDMVPIGIGKDGRQILMKRPASANHPPVKLKLPFADNSLWFRYYQAGEDASLTQHDKEKAKQYWMASLGELEKHPPAKGSDMFLSVKLSSLEAGLMGLYPEDWSKETGESAAILAKRKEQVGVLSRIANVNAFFAPKDDLLRIKSKERYDTAKQSYDQAVAAAKSEPKSEPKTD